MTARMLNIDRLRLRSPTVTDVQHVAAGLGVPCSDLATDLPIQQVSCGVSSLLVSMGGLLDGLDVGTGFFDGTGTQC